MATSKDLYNEQIINNAFEKLYKINDLKVFQALGLIGEKVINKARLEGDYQNRTSNLRNSTGYIINEGSKTTKKDYKNESSEGGKKGLQVAKEFSSAKEGEIELVINAGMEYAIHVESKGKTVLSAFIPEAVQVAKTIEGYYK